MKAKATRAPKSATTPAEPGTAASPASFDLEDSMGVVANAAVGFGFLESIFLSVKELSKTDVSLASRLSSAGAYWAGTLTSEMLHAQDAIEAAQKGGAV